mmetsp:Transcript_99021/g.288794  ORF Transcript_99021/g.288794 Transcript_99021/m.288794 type:complete len:281 (+) Transcript_99021:516-1358(+)
MRAAAARFLRRRPCRSAGCRRHLRRRSFATRWPAFPRVGHERPEVANGLLEHAAFPEDLATAAAHPKLIVGPQGLLAHLRVAPDVGSRGEAPVPGVALHTPATQAVRVHFHSENVNHLSELLISALAAKHVGVLGHSGRQLQLPAPSQDDSPVFDRLSEVLLCCLAVLAQDDGIQTKPSHLASKLGQRRDDHKTEVAVDALLSTIGSSGRPHRLLGKHFAPPLPPSLLLLVGQGLLAAVSGPDGLALRQSSPTLPQLQQNACIQRSVVKLLLAQWPLIPI